MNIMASMLVALTMAILPAHAQRSAVSADLSPEAAAETFTRMVVDVCVLAVVGDGVSSLAAARDGKVQPTQDAATRRQAGAAPDETVWDVADARGVVTVREARDRCVVSVYGPPAGATLMVLADRARAAGLATGAYRVWQPDQAENTNVHITGLVQGKPISIRVDGANPGAPDHRSKFSVVTATVSVSQ